MVGECYREDFEKDARSSWIRQTGKSRTPNISIENHQHVDEYASKRY